MELTHPSCKRKAVNFNFLIFKKQKDDNKVLFIDASREFKSGKNQNQLTPENIQNMLSSVLKESDDIIISGGIWPEPNTFIPSKTLASLFFSRDEEGKIALINDYNIPSESPYQNESWYVSVAHENSTNHISWSDVYIDPFTKQKMITASQPYFNQGQFVGVATIDISLKGLISVIEAQAEKNKLGIVINNGDTMIADYKFNVQEDMYVVTHQMEAFNWQIKVINSYRTVSDEIYSQIINIELGIVPILFLCVIMAYYFINRSLINPIVLISTHMEESTSKKKIDINSYLLHELKKRIEEKGNTVEFSSQYAAIIVNSEIEIALYSSDFFIIPLKADDFSVKNANKFLGKVASFISSNNLDIKFLGFFFGCILVTENSKEYYTRIFEKNNITLLFDAFIRQDSEVKKAVQKGLTIFQHNPNCRASLDFETLTNEFLKKLNNE